MSDFETVGTKCYGEKAHAIITMLVNARHIPYTMLSLSRVDRSELVHIFLAEQKYVKTPCNYRGVLAADGEVCLVRTYGMKDLKASNAVLRRLSRRLLDRLSTALPDVVDESTEEWLLFPSLPGLLDSEGLYSLLKDEYSGKQVYREIGIDCWNGMPYSGKPVPISIADIREVDRELHHPTMSYMSDPMKTEARRIAVKSFLDCIWPLIDAYSHVCRSLCSGSFKASSYPYLWGVFADSDDSAWCRALYSETLSSGFSQLVIEDAKKAGIDEELLRDRALADLERFFESPFFKELVESWKLVTEKQDELELPSIRSMVCNAAKYRAVYV